MGEAFNFRFLLIVNVFILPFLFSCSDEIKPDSDIDDNNPENALTLLIPNTETQDTYSDTRANFFPASRAKEDPNEATINNLWFFAFPTTGSTGETKIVRLSASNSSIKYDPEYTSYTITSLEDGDYHIYVLGNFERYIRTGALTSEMSEADVKSLITDFSTNYLLKNNLPMFCLNTDITGNGYSNGVFSYNSDNNTLVAHLTFLCAKVRYTILYDNTDNKFKENDVDFTGAEAANVRSKSIITGTQPQGYITDGLSNLILNRTVYPSNSNSQYLKKDRTQYEDDLEETDDWSNPAKRAWQGIAYLPENDATNETSKTKLIFSASGNQVKDTYELTLINKENQKLERGKFYDMVAYLETPEDKTLKASCSINDWSPEIIYYSLHEQFELIISASSVAISGNEPAYISYQSEKEVSGVSPIIYWKTEGDITVVTEDLFDGLQDKESYSQAPLYEFNFTENAGTVVIYPNKNLPEKVLATVAQNQDIFEKVNYFYLKAGNIMKKISVLQLNP